VAHSGRYERDDECHADSLAAPLLPSDMLVTVVCAMHVHDANEDRTTISQISLENNIESEGLEKMYQQSLLIFGGFGGDLKVPAGVLLSGPKPRVR
jgi:hypothetical protein